MAKYPHDQFDNIPGDLARVGAHRAPPKAGRGWVTFAWAALITGVLVVAGLAGLNLYRGQGFLGETALPSATPTVEPTADPILDPTLIDPARGISITVLNGTTTIDLEDVAGDALLAKSWPVGARLVATERDEETTIVYYSNPLDEDVARGIVIALGAGEVRESSAYPGAPITIVLGADYSGTPAL